MRTIGLLIVGIGSYLNVAVSPLFVLAVVVGVVLYVGGP